MNSLLEEFDFPDEGRGAPHSVFDVLTKADPKQGIGSCGDARLATIRTGACWQAP